MSKKYALSTEPMENIVFDFIYKMALDDATRRIKGINQAIRKVIWNKKIKDDIVKKYTESVIKGENPDFKDCINKILDVVHDEFKIKITFGIIQKLLSMTMKYLYIRYYGTEIEKNFNCCNGPMDSVMRDSVLGYYDNKKLEKKLENPGFDRETAWSKLDKGTSDKKYKLDNYDNFQKGLELIKDNENICNKIELDFRLWKPFGLEDEK